MSDIEPLELNLCLTKQNHLSINACPDFQHVKLTAQPTTNALIPCLIGKDISDFSRYFIFFLLTIFCLDGCQNMAPAGGGITARKKQTEIVTNFVRKLKFITKIRMDDFISRVNNAKKPDAAKL